MFPPQLFRISSSDEQSNVLSLFYDDQLVQATGPNIQTNHPVVPTNRVLLLSTAAAFVIPEAGEWCKSIDMYVVNDAGQGFYWFHTIHNQVTTTGLTFSAAWSGEAIIPPGAHVRIAANMDTAAAATHAMQTWVHGVVIPRGNLLEY